MMKYPKRINYDPSLVKM